MTESNKKRTVLVATGIYPPDIGGPATYSKILYDELPIYGVYVRVHSFGSVRYLPTIVRHIAYFFTLLIKGFRCDIIYAQDPVSVGFPAWLVSNVLHKPFFLKVVGDYAWEQGTARGGVTDSLDEFVKHSKKYSMFVRILKYIETKVAEAADVIIVPSQYLKKIVTAWGIQEQKITVIPNAVETPDNIANKDVLRKMMGLEGRVVISVGRLVPWKGFDVLIDVVEDLVHSMHDLSLIIVGDGVERKSLEQKVKDKQLEHHIRFTGKLDQATLWRYIHASDMYVLNTNYEGLPHQALECMALEVPVVTTSVGGNVEVIQNQKNGILVSYNDVTGFKEAIRKIFEDTDFREQIITQAKTDAQKYSKHHMIGRLTKLIEQYS